MLICYTLNNVCTLHTIGFCNTTFTAIFHKNQPYVFQHSTLTQSHTQTHTQHINTSTPTEASNHKQYAQARTRGNVLGRFRTLLRQVPDFFFLFFPFFFTQRMKITHLLERRIFLRNSYSYKVHFTLQWMDAIIKKSWIINSQHLFYSHVDCEWCREYFTCFFSFQLWFSKQVFSALYFFF